MALSACVRNQGFPYYERPSDYGAGWFEVRNDFDLFSCRRGMENCCIWMMMIGRLYGCRFLFGIIFVKPIFDNFLQEFT